MKICYDNLERIYFTSNKTFRTIDGNKTRYIYKDKCKECGEPFLASYKNQEFCSKSCSRKGKKHTEETRKKMSEAQTGEDNPMYGKKLSEEHKKKISEANKGKKRSEETRKKMSEANKGKKHTEKSKKKMSEARKGRNHPNYGRNHSEETKKKIGEASKGRKLSEEHKKKISEANTGENHPRWKGGISAEPYCYEFNSKEFKDFIKERDGNICLNPECNKKSNILCVHHIDYNKKNCELDNLITLCLSCNTKANTDRERHKARYQAIINERY